MLVYIVQSITGLLLFHVSALKKQDHNMIYLLNGLGHEIKLNHMHKNE